MAVLEAPLTSRAVKTAGADRAAGREPRRLPGVPSLRRDGAGDFAGPRVLAVGDSEDEVEGYVRSRRFSGLRFRLRGGVPKSVVGRVLSALFVLGALAGFTAVLWEARTMLLHDQRLVIPSSSAIQITGNNHLTRPQLLSIFGEDVERNLLTVSLADRRAELESLPWVAHATVMRLLPNRIRVAIVERTPVAFVRQGGRIGLVDANGVLLDLSPEAASDSHYSFPVVTGVSAAEPDSVRAARMKLFLKFMADLDAGGEHISSKLSEVDLSSPEDVKALIPSGSADVLVHFGDDDFLARYKSFESNLPGWKTSYPRLAAVDMRYEHSVVLEMAPGAAVPVHDRSGDVSAAPVAKPGTKGAAKPGAKTPAKPQAKAGAKPERNATPPAKSVKAKSAAQPKVGHSAAAPNSHGGQVGPQ